MNPFYQKYIDRENEIYRGMTEEKPSSGKLEPPALEAGIDWLCQGTESVLDFGCGSGALLFACAFRGVKRLLGIDLSEAAVQMARRAGCDLPQCEFQHGSLELLPGLASGSFSGVILSNILDNLRPGDSMRVLNEVARLLQPDGKALIKLNPYITPEQITAWHIIPIDGDLLDDGLLLWNRKTAGWQAELIEYFQSVQRKDVYFPEQDQHNRMFLCEGPRKTII